MKLQDPLHPKHLSFLDLIALLHDFAKDYDKIYNDIASSKFVCSPHHKAEFFMLYWVAKKKRKGNSIFFNPSINFL